MTITDLRRQQYEHKFANRNESDGIDFRLDQKLGI